MSRWSTLVAPVSRNGLCEKLVRPKLITVTFTNNEAFGKEVQDFLTENGDILASEDTIEMFAGLRMQEKVRRQEKKRLGRTKQTSPVPSPTCSKFQHAVSQTLFSITNISLLFSIHPTRMARGRSQ